MTAMCNTVNGKMVYTTNDTYVKAILDAGGLPLLIPACGHEEDYAELAEQLDGLLIPGGYDVNPLLYGEEAIPQTTYARQADDLFEYALIRKMAEWNKPILGICRGIQVINTAFGGTLYQDIPAQRPESGCHRQEGGIRYEPFHHVDLEPDSRMAAIFGTHTLQVNTYHHQALKDVAEGFRVSGRARDGIIEAFEHEKQYILAVQWHPECMYEVHPIFKKLFDDFIAKAAE